MMRLESLTIGFSDWGPVSVVGWKIAVIEIKMDFRTGLRMFYLANLNLTLL